METTDDRKEKGTCFVIGPIGAKGSEVRKRADLLYNLIIAPSVAPTHILMRADLDQKPGLITDAIIQRINDSDLVIADFSTLNPNVFYELGIRHAAAKATIHMASDGTELPFDNIGYRTIFYDLGDWDRHQTTILELRAQLGEIMKPDFKVANPVTHALTMKVFAASADTEETAIVQIMDRISKIEGQIKTGTRSSTKSDGSLGSLAKAALGQVNSRKNDLKGMIEILSEEAGIKFSDYSKMRFVEINSNDADYYQDIVRMLERGDTESIIREIKSYDPPSQDDDDIPF